MYIRVLDIDISKTHSLWVHLMVNTGNVRTFVSQEEYSFYAFPMRSWNKILLF